MADRREVRFKAEYAAMLAPFVATQALRPHLHGVFVTQHPKTGILLVATNGHEMAIVHDANGETNGDWICRVSKLLSAACRRKGRKPDEGAMFLHYVGDVAYVTSRGLNRDDGIWGDIDVAEIGQHHLAIEHSPHIDGSFPDWRRVVPTVEPENCAPAFNAQYLANFYDVAQMRNQKAIRILAHSETGPVVVLVEGLPEFYGILMPMRAEGLSRARPVPDWMPELPQAEAAE